MTMSTTTVNTRPGSLPRSTGAVLLGFIAVLVLSLGTDQVLHALEVYPPWGQPMREPGLCLLCVSENTVKTEIPRLGAARPARP
jgi:hypothetical protein